MNTILNTIGMALLTTGVAQADIVHVDDIIVDGSLCVGFDCVNGEAFGSDTIRLKENNLRITAIDTSIAAGFPSNDWQLTFNDSGAGLNKFSIDDITGGKTPFTIEAGAPSHSLYADDTGKIGLGTSTPTLEMHITSGDTPGVRLDQDGSDGWGAQTWDIAGNESNFFIRDVSNSSKLPFRIKPGAPSNSLYIAADGDIGIGISNPSGSVHVQRADGTAQVKVEETNGVAGPRTLFQIANNGNTKFGVLNTQAGVEWSFANGGGDFRLSRQGSGVVEFTLSNAGNLTIAGNLTELSSRAEKYNIIAMNGEQVLKKVLALPINEWTYNDSKEGIRHVGPMAEDFHAAFGLGESETGIATLDTSGVALAAIQGLKVEQDRELAQRDAQITSLQAELDQLKEIVQRLTTKGQWASLN